MAAGDANLYCNVRKCICLDTDFCPQLYVPSTKILQHVLRNAAICKSGSLVILYRLLTLESANLPKHEQPKQGHNSSQEP